MQQVHNSWIKESRLIPKPESKIEMDEPKLHKVFSLFLYGGTSKPQKWNPAGFLVPDSESVTT